MLRNIRQQVKVAGRRERYIGGIHERGERWNITRLPWGGPMWRPVNCCIINQGRLLHANSPMSVVATPLTEATEEPPNLFECQSSRFNEIRASFGASWSTYEFVFVMLGPSKNMIEFMNNFLRSFHFTVLPVHWVASRYSVKRILHFAHSKQWWF